MRYYGIQSVLTLLVVLVHVLVAVVQPHSYPMGGRLFWILLASSLFLSGKTFLAYTLVRSRMGGNPYAFTNAVMGSLMLKMVLSIAFVLFVLLVVGDVNKMAFAASYFSAYLLFTSFEIYALLNNLRPDSKKELS
ncbi:MAG: hypothetical protein LW884_10840 [Bacteroidetes bacterium]|nr:hypothetical protein [Bacteroidota bacterium]